jgi:transketolase
MANELILIVEDNDKNLKLARDVLQFGGFRTLEATDAETAISLAREHQPDLILMGTGSEVSLCLQAQERLQADGVKVRVVSMPSYEIYEQQPLEYRLSVLPADVRKRMAIEAGTSLGWRRYVGIAPDGAVLARRSFGASAPRRRRQPGF